MGTQDSQASLGMETQDSQASLGDGDPRLTGLPGLLITQTCHLSVPAHKLVIGTQCSFWSPSRFYSGALIVSHCEACLQLWSPDPFPLGMAGLPQDPVLGHHFSGASQR